jgi:hypothetical protein
MRSVIFKVVVLSVAVVAITLAGSQSAAARPRPTVAWTSARSASAGMPIAVTWDSTHLGKGAKLLIQRPVGTARVYKTVVKLAGPSGSTQLPAQPIGTYPYRLVAFEGNQIVAKQAVTVGVFGKVPFSTYFENEGDSGVYAAPTVSFPYVAYLYGPTEPHQTEALLSVKKNDCSAVHVEFITGENFPGDADEYSSTVGTVTIVQQTRDPVSGSAAFDAPGSVDAQLVPGQTWSVLGSWAGGDALPDIYYNGYVICDSAKPLSQQ